ncbi:phage tail protein [Porphyrobacter sp. SLTP]|uniref:phage tail protein n=1 Tax=Porphyrobacter sp. SLTP TaxID=2683266 RepID=UPI0014124448|nr:tail fiber protein [Porphyrobacter sp. SLTP]NBB24505.1 phage tail protein [Porphyrobacter sp. SLTP]
MADPFVAEIRVVPFNFAPRGWAWCDGQILPLSQNTALFSLLGTTYGGNGESNFALPNLQASAVMGPGQGPGLSDRFLGEQGGSQTVTLLPIEMPGHAHTMQATSFPANASLASAGAAIARSVGGAAHAPTGGPAAVMAPEALAPAGGDMPHNNMMPYLTMYFIIALQGVFPPRS